ncbi:NADPH-dependent ferric siderophore reductase, contains FAD-binding and SIP domains [Friedmanniella luteola]|uniref:NADPH-dependent ferric siderophore reductase, contains FAD-binding and SIP domains n=1 Tax=Friedmanniella luteola TaxID=546871 RepID=A0A1H1YPH4_9ACTN|nr:siderophore-interacting protein [Friedmanniella luteola]SDT23373.1 NADPH-dependent ferric siderophore reductase, contains FAD-binding and SIP domains [Friedmanniella luteola]
MPPLTLYRAEVRATARLSPHLVRVTFGPAGALDALLDLTAFRSTGVGDERLVLVLPTPGERHTPVPDADGGWDHLDPGRRPAQRSYTVRASDPTSATLVVDVVVHEGGPGSAWALRAAEGDVVLLTAAMGWYRPPPEATWQLLVADLTALPALARITETSPLPSHALVEVPEPADRLPLPAAASTRWLCGTGNGLGPSGLLRALRDLPLPPGPGYVWCAGEAAETRALRRHLRHARGLTTREYVVLGYWRHDQADWDRRYAELAGGLEGVYADAVARGLSSTDALEAYDDALERVGL